MEKGLFIALEGGEGSGKSTLIRNMKTLYEEQGHEVVILREPGGTQYAEDIRKLFLSSSNLTGETVALLMNSARLDNIDKIIEPALKEGKVVIADRFSGSTLVYQGLRKGEYEQVEAITKHIPMISIFLDTPPEVGIQRIIDNNREVNRFDMMPIEVHNDIYEGYMMLEDLKPGEYWDIVLDGTLTQEELKEELLKEFIPLSSKKLHEGQNTTDIKSLLRGSLALSL